MSGDLLTTPLSEWHRAHGGRMVEFGGWSMPVQYTTITAEHAAVRGGAGLFDISHMGRLFFSGKDAQALIDHATTNNVGRLAPWQIQYSLMCNEDGGVLDDVLVYRLGDKGWGGATYMVVCNASNRRAVVARFDELIEGREATMDDRTLETAMIAVQGPRAPEVVARIAQSDPAPADMKYYHCAHSAAVGVAALLSRTGYTGEDGVELILPADKAREAWEALMAVDGVVACGLGARDTLRFEAAMPLYGHELSETIDPYEAGVGWAVKLAKGDFVGRSALKVRKVDPKRARVGLALAGKRIARQGATVHAPDGREIGVVTSGTFAPTLGKSLAMALIEAPLAAVGTALTVDVRGQSEPAEVVPLPFYSRPKS